MNSMKYNYRNSEKGSILFIVFLLILAVGTLGIVAFKRTATDKTLTSGYAKSVKAFYIADAGIERAKSQLQSMTQQNVISSIVQGGTLFNSVSFGEGEYTVKLSGAIDTNLVRVYDSHVYTLKNVNATFTVLAKEFTAGAGGAQIPIYVRRDITFYSSPSAYPNNWPFLISSAPVVEGNTTTYTDIEERRRIYFYIHYQASCPCGICTYAFLSTDTSPRRMYLLKNGDLLPPYPAFANQESLADIFKDNNLVDSNMRVSLGYNQVVLICELAQNFNPCAPNIDYQDLVILMDFFPSVSQQFTIRSTGTLPGGVSRTIELTAKKINDCFCGLEMLSWREVY